MEDLGFWVVAFSSVAGLWLGTCGAARVDATCETTKNASQLPKFRSMVFRQSIPGPRHNSAQTCSGGSL